MPCLHGAGKDDGKDFKKCHQDSSGKEKLFSVWKQYVEVWGSEDRRDGAERSSVGIAKN